MIRFRPHHFLCTLSFRGKGYSAGFIKNFKKIADLLRETPQGDDEWIEVVGATDDICGPCPNRQGVLCETQEKITTLDRNHAEILGLEVGDRLTWKEAKARIRERVRPEDLDRICASCSWLSFGLCREAVEKLRQVSLGLIIAVFFAGSAFAAKTAVGNVTAVEKVSTKKEDNLQGSPKIKNEKNGFISNGKRSFDFKSNSEEVRFIDQVLSEMMQKRRTRLAQTTRRAFDLMKKEKFSATRTLAVQLRKDRLLGYLGIYLMGEAHLREAAALVGKKQYKAALARATSAIDQFGLIRQHHPEVRVFDHVSEKTGLAEVTLADAHYGLKRWKESKKLYERGLERLFRLNRFRGITGQSLENYTRACIRIRTPECRDWVERIVRNLWDPSPERSRIAAVIPEVSEIQPLEHYARRFTRTYPSTEEDKAAIEKAMNTYLRIDKDDAVDELKSFLEGFPLSEQNIRAQYWYARANEQDGKKEKASEHYEKVMQSQPLGYYAILASVATSKNLDSYLSGTFPKAMTRSAALTPPEKESLERAEALIAAGAHELASLELSRFEPKSTYSSPFITYLATLNHECGNHRMAFQMLAELFKRQYDDVASSYTVRQIFPVRYKEVIQEQADQFRVDPTLILSLMKQESAFSEKVISRSGAVGLMQLMPFTAIEVDGSIEQHQLLFGGQNVRIGTQYLARLIKSFDGNIAYALAGYNAGPTRVRKWIKEGAPDWTLAEFVESIPYAETRGYVSGIIRNYYWYTYLLKGHRLRSLDYFWGASGPLPVSTDLVSQR